MVDLNKQELQTIHDAAVVLTEDFHHAEQVCRLSLAIYDDLSSVHGYGKRTRRLLAAAALLHDIGWSISTVSHNKCGMTFIIEDRMLPLSLYERILVALAARYHRGGTPKRRHNLYGNLSKHDRQKVCLIAGIIRIADGLDRSHRSVVRSVHAKLSDETLVLLCTGYGRGGPERRASARKADLLMKALSAKIQICWKRCP